ncbi:hypothetical protein JL720_16296 [Aureococcus anophagefferens]|nr:hypothetical protein JL720_16296 [Aureococcus anophagefferens]
MGWLENRLRKRRVAPSDGDARNGTWSAADKACLQRAIDPLRANFRRRPFAFLGSEATTMLCSSKPGEVYERLTSMLSNMSIVSGVVLSAFAGAALSPLAPDDYPPGADQGRRCSTPSPRSVWNSNLQPDFNAAVTVAIQLLVCLYSTFTLYILTANAPSPSATYRHLMHMARWIGFLEFMTFVPALGGFVLVGIAATLRCGDFSSTSSPPSRGLRDLPGLVRLPQHVGVPLQLVVLGAPRAVACPGCCRGTATSRRTTGGSSSTRPGGVSPASTTTATTSSTTSASRSARELEDWIRTALPGFPRCVDIAEDPRERPHATASSRPRRPAASSRRRRADEGLRPAAGRPLPSPRPRCGRPRSP